MNKNNICFNCRLYEAPDKCHKNYPGEPVWTMQYLTCEDYELNPKLEGVKSIKAGNVKIQF